MVLAADVFYLLGIGASAVEVDEHDGAGVAGDFAFQAVGVHLQGFGVWLNEYGCESVFGDGEYGCDVGVGGYDYFVADVQLAYFHIGTENECKGIESVAHTDAVVCADVGGVGLFEAFCFFAAQVLSAVEHALRCGIYFGLVGEVDCL